MLVTTVDNLLMETFGAWLQEELNKRKMSQADLSRASGLTTAAVAYLINGRRNAGEDACSKLAHALKLPPETVFRAAGLLPPVSEDEAKFEDWKYLLEGLNERDLNLLRDLAEKMAAENEKERALKSLNPRRVANG